MTDQIDQITDTDVEEIESTDGGAGRRRRMFLTGAGIAGAAALVGKSGVADAADGDNVVAGQDVTSTSTTSITNQDSAVTDRSSNAFRGNITDASNNSHAILGVTQGGGHAIAGVVGTAIDDFPADSVAATWGRHYGPAAAVEGQQLAVDVDVAGPANAVKGIIEEPSNGSHSVLGLTAGGGHAVAGVIGAQVQGEAPTFPTNEDGTPNTVAATWGRHYGPAAAVEGQQLAEGVALAGPANAVKGRIDKTTNGSHAVLGVTNGAGHSIAGDTPADAAGPDGEGSNTVAATWGRHQGAGAGIGGISVGGYGGEFVGGKAHVRLIQVDNDNLADGQDPVVGPPTDDDHALGELFADGRGKLYFNSGTGSNFHQLVQQELFVDPQRAWDTRPGQGPDNAGKGIVSAGEIESIDLTAFTDVPAGASGVLVNLSVANTGGKGFLTVYNGDSDTVPNAASLTWSDADQRVTNSLVVRPNDAGVINVYLAETTANIIVDVTGYIV